MKSQLKSAKNPHEIRPPRRRIFRNVVLGTLLAVLAFVVIFRPSGGAPTDPASPSDEQSSSTTADPSDQPTDTSSPDPEVAALIERSQAFAKEYYSYNWQEPDVRLKKLEQFGEKSWLASIKAAEKDIIRQTMRKTHSEHEVKSVEFQDGGPENENSPVDTVSMTLNIQKTIEDDTTAQPMTLTFSCNLLWKYDAKSKTWLISQTDPT